MRIVLATTMIAATIAAGAAARELTMEEAVAAAMENNPSVHAARERAEAAVGRARQAKGHRLPSLDLAEVFSYTDNPAEVFAFKLNQERFNFEELQETLARILAGELGAADGSERQALMDHYLAAQEGPLACERMIDVLEESGYGERQPPTMPVGDFAQGWMRNKLRTAVKHVNMRRPGPNNKLAYHNRRFPEISVEEIEKKISRFGHLLNRFEAIRVAQHSRHIFGINK